MHSSSLESLVPELGKYHLVAELARGGMGIVHLAASQGPGSFNKLLVIKELKPELAGEDAFVTMFLEEARLAARLTHPNIVQTIEVSSEGSRHFMVMEFLDGRSLHRLIGRFKDQGGFPVAAHLRLIAESLLGLQYAHDLQDFDGQPLGIVHRDVSPLNLLMTFDGQAKVLDFGIAKSIDSSENTQTGVLKGRVAYMAPEQALCLRVDRRADVYSVGVMLWEAAAGRRLWPGMNDVEILSKHLREGPPRLSKVRPDVPRDLEAICARAMERRPEDRYESAAAMLEDLEAHLAARNDVIPLRAIGPLVGRAFAEERRRMSTLIEETLARVRSGPRSGVMLRWETQFSRTLDATLAVGDATGQPSGPRGVPPVVDVPSLRALPRATPSRVRPESWRMSRRAAVGAAGGIALLLGILGVAALAGVRTGRAVAPPETVGAAVLVPAASAVPDRVDVVVRVSPASALITIDGAPVSSNPFFARFTRDAKVHHVLSSADGYEAKLEEVFFASDLTIDVSLDRRAVPLVRCDARMGTSHPPLRPMVTGARDGP
jgi:hypothetical protein